MSDKGHNIFDYFRGPRPRRGVSKEDLENEVLENNVTKALLNVMEYCPELGRQFITWLNEKHLIRRGLTLKPPDIKDVRILEGPTSDEIADANITRILLGIKKHEADNDRDTSKGERLDGTVVGQGWLVAIESKLGGMERHQLKREEKKIRATAVVQLLWKEVQECFERALKMEGHQAPSEKERFLVEQFCGFIRQKGLVPFPGFQKRHFDCPLRGQKEENGEQEELKDLFSQLRGQLVWYKYSDDGERLNNLYWETPSRVKGLRAKERDYAEIQFRCRSKSSVPVNVTLWPDKENRRVFLDVYADVEDRKRLRRLASFIEKRNGRAKLARKLRSAQFSGYRVGLYDKEWKKIDEHEYECSKISNRDLTGLAESIRTTRNEEVHLALTKVFVLDTPISAAEHELPPDGESQLREIARAMRYLYPFARFASGAPWEKTTGW